MTEPLYFAHANSFPASIYRKMFTRLAPHYNVMHLDTVGHDPAFPVTDGWPHLVEETIRAIEQQANRPVCGVGHSLGGVLVLFAAVARPDLFQGLVILDSPLFGPWRSRGIWLAKRLGFIDRLTPGGETLRRRDCWASVEMAYEYFLRKPVFARFDRDCLMDYAQFGTCPDGAGGRRLKFRPRVEDAIYRSLPHHLSSCAGRLQVPAVYLAATQGSVLKRSDRHFVERHLGMHVASHPGSHLFPLEHPIETAGNIHRAFVRMGVSTASDQMQL
jgi:pimeloyl-ACP methyl ester carboxylesterase